MKYPKLAAALDEMLAKLIRENGEAAVQWVLEMGAVIGKADGAPPEVLPPIPATKEEVSDGD